MAEGVSILQYPMASCALHNSLPLRPGYAVCDHVANGADIARHVAPTAWRIGLISCARCWEDEMSKDSVRLARATLALEVQCAHCVEYHLGKRLPPCEAEWPRETVQ